MLREKTTTDYRIIHADPATRELNRIEVALAEAEARLMALAELNPAEADQIKSQLEESRRHRAELVCPLESLANGLRESWLDGTLVEPADDAGA